MQSELLEQFGGGGNETLQRPQEEVEALDPPPQGDDCEEETDDWLETEELTLLETDENEEMEEADETLDELADETH